MIRLLRVVFREWRRWRRRRNAERERRRRTLAAYDRVISPVVWLDAEDELEAYLDRRFGAGHLPFGDGGGLAQPEPPPRSPEPDRGGARPARLDLLGRRRPF